MTFHDWINNIRWKYFTNNKSGLIFKETTKEFRIVHKMTEKKRYELKEYDMGLFVQDNENNKTQYYSQSKSSMNKVVDLLNEQEEEIQELKQRNQRQYELLKELTELMYERQWGKLENMVEEWEKADELLQKEWHNYGDL